MATEAPHRCAWLGEQRMGWIPPHSLPCPAPLCQLHTAASRPFGAVLTVRRINERKAPGTAPAWHVLERSKRQLW